MLALLLLLLVPLPAVQSYYVAPALRGAPSGNGTAERPWDLATALAGAGGRIQPGDTVWLAGGRYPGAFRTELRGEAGRLIVFRQQRGARATIDGTLRADGAYLAFWGFEIMQSNPAHGTYGLEARTNHGRFINLIIHDAGSMGVSFWTPGENAELYGCIVYNNGTHENLDHGVYVHNERGTKRLVDNVFFNNLAYGVHAYAGRGNPPQRGIVIQGNIAFNNGAISHRSEAKGNILVGGQVPVAAVDVSFNYLFYSGVKGVNLRLGYAPISNEDLIARGNYIWGGETRLSLGNWLRAQVQGNTIQGNQAAVFVRPNLYEPGRAHIVAYNHAGSRALRADVSGVLKPGDQYELRSVQDVFGAPVARGTYSGDSIVVPMADPVPVALPIGRVTGTPPVTRPLFDAFLLTLSGAAPSGTPAPPAP